MYTEVLEVIAKIKMFWWHKFVHTVLALLETETVSTFWAKINHDTPSNV